LAGDDSATFLKLGETFQGLEVLEVIGRGGMGVVYKARQPALDRLVALKTLLVDKASVPEFRARFQREAKALASLTHPNITAVYDFGEKEGNFFFVMEFVEGVDLKQYLRESRLDVKKIQALVGQICDALDFAHSEGIVHRDIKPANILIDKRGRVKIADFGLVKLTGSDQSLLLTQSGAVMGTAHYMAPEQLDDPLGVDHRADIYSIGVVLYEMLTGEHPLGRFAPPSRKHPSYAPLDPVVMRALEKEPDERYQNASDLKKALEEATTLTGSTIAMTYNEKTVLKSSLRKKRTGPLWIIASICLLLGGAGGFYAWKKNQEKPPPTVETPPGKEPIAKPPVQGPSPEEKWKNSFEAMQGRLAFANYPGASPGRVKEARALMEGMPAEHVESTTAWFLGQVRGIPKKSWPKKEWLSRKTEARRFQAWCLDIGAILGDSAPEELGAVSARFAPVIAYRGTITLKIYTSPPSELRSLRRGEEWIVRDGKWVGKDSVLVGKSLHTPLGIRNLDIGNYVLQLAEKSFTIEGKDLENGETYLFTGSLDKGTLRLRASTP
jgi:serine/threonine protein kinase